MKKIILIYFFALFVMNAGLAQSNTQNIFESYEGNPSEKVYVSRNNSVVFAGEYLFYTVFCLNDKTKQPSKISNLAYVVLVSEDGELIFEHKIGLRDSRGYGDFFVPTTVPSGNYKMIAYTQWMRNGDQELFFKDDISIINPYRNNQHNDVDMDTLKIHKPNLSYFKAEDEDKRFVIETDKQSYGKRSMVKLKLINFRGASAHGYYTLSVKKKSEVQMNVLNHNPISFLKLHENRAKSKLPKYNDIEYIPEELGERIIGRVIPKEENISPAERKVSVSIPGDDFQLLAAITDQDGFFYVDVLKAYTKPMIIAQVLDKNSDDLKVEIIKNTPITTETLKFQEFDLNPSMKANIEERSVYNQIENAYYQVKPDTLRIEDRNDPFLGSVPEEYDLDDYTRFPTLVETMVEILPFASIKKVGKEEFAFYVRLFEDQEGEPQSALVFIDGVLVTNYNEIVEFDATQIKKVTLIRDKFEIAGRYYRGMINIQTIEKNYYEVGAISNGVKQELIPMEPRKNYFTQQYLDETKERSKRIPDYRHQLVWNPNINFTGKEKHFDFYTSDVPGTYEIVLEGFSIYGRPVVITDTFVVE